MDVLLEMRHITKSFPGVVADNDVSLRVKKQSIHALIGENGAGKSTLMNILCGLQRPDSGEILLGGKTVSIGSPYEAIGLGIGMVHQHFMLVSDLTVLENIILGADTPNRMGMTDYKKGRRAVNRIIEEYNFPIDLNKRIFELSVGEMQRVEIIKALYRGAEILILDEPTAVLTPQETEKLFTVLRSLVSMGKTILFITHKLKEVLAISDEITVMRAGKVTGEIQTAQADEVLLASMMVGRDVVLRVRKMEANPGEELLGVHNLEALNDRRLPALRNVSFTVRRGEIVGIAGVDGNGQGELVEALTGLRRLTGGTITLRRKDVSRCGGLERRRAGIAHIPSDRMAFGIDKKCSVHDNLILNVYRTPPYCRRGTMRRIPLAEFSRQLIEQFGIAAASPETTVETLSGGNMQKVVVAREIASDPDVLVAAQPTRGVDVGAIEFIHNELIRLRDQGKGIVLVSVELDEVLSLADRVLVMYEGEIVAEFDNKDLDELEVGLYMTGAKRMERVV